MAPTVRERNKKVIESLTLQGPTAEQGKRMDAVRKSAQQFAKVVVKNTESGPESTLAQRHIEDAVARAVRSILFDAAAPSSEVVATPPVKRGPGRPRKVQPEHAVAPAKRRGRPPKIRPSVPA